MRKGEGEGGSGRGRGGAWGEGLMPIRLRKGSLTGAGAADSGPRACDSRVPSARSYSGESAARLRMEMGEKSLLQRGKTKQREQSDTNSKKGKKNGTHGARLPRPAFPALSSQRQACRHTRERCTERKRDKTDWQRKKINLKNGEKYEMADLGQKVLWRRRRHHRQKRRRLR